MAQKKGKKALYMKKASPYPQEGEKGPTNRLFSRGSTRQAPTLAAGAPLRAPMSECDYKIHNIYSTLIYIKIHSRMHPIELFLKRNSRKSIPSNPLAMKLNSAVYTHRTNDNESGMYYNTPYFLKKYPPPPPFEHRFVPPPPDNDRVCDHNALLAFPQEKISHYTTELVIPEDK